jgi:hypothetical protein
MRKPAGKKTQAVMLVSCAVLVITIGALYGFHLSKNERGIVAPDRPFVASLGKGHQPGVRDMEITEKMPSIPPVRLKETAWARNPFLPVEKPLSPGPVRKSGEAEKISPPSVELQGIIRSEGGFLAIINGERRKEGSFVSGWKLVKIDNYRVWLRRGGEKLKLELSEKPEEMSVR